MSMLHKAIKGFEDYLISDTGQVFSLKNQKYLKPRKHTKGYYQVNLRKNGICKTVYIHRLVAYTFIPNPENKPTVDHINRDRLDNRVENLRWANHAEQRENSVNSKVLREKQGTPIIEIVDNKQIKYAALRAVPDIRHNTLSRHINKGKTDFYAKGRHFILPKDTENSNRKEETVNGCQ